jgi:hypothetical protein
MSVHRSHPRELPSRSQLAMRKGAGTMTRAARRRPSRAYLEQLVEEAPVDAYGASEQRCGLFTHLALPFETELLGVPVMIERVNLTEQRR